LRKRHFERTLLDKVDVWIFLRQRMESLGLRSIKKLAEPGAFLHSLNDFFFALPRMSCRAGGF